MAAPARTLDELQGPTLRAAHSAGVMAMAHRALDLVQTLLNERVHA